MVLVHDYVVSSLVVWLLCLIHEETEKRGHDWSREELRPGPKWQTGLKCVYSVHRNGQIQNLLIVRTNQLSFPTGDPLLGVGKSMCDRKQPFPVVWQDWTCVASARGSFSSVICENKVWFTWWSISSADAKWHVSLEWLLVCPLIVFPCSTEANSIVQLSEKWSQNI